MSFISRKLLTYFLLYVIVRENAIDTYADPDIRTTLIAWFNYNTLKPNSVIVDVKADAKTIVDSHSAPNVIGSILPFRNQIQCQQINTEMIAIAADQPLVPDKYVPCSKPDGQFSDLIFSLWADRDTVLAMYLGQLLANRDIILSTIILTLVNDMKVFRDVYDKNHPEHKWDVSFEEIEEPIKSVFLNWIQTSREQDAPLDMDAVDADAITLLQEQPSWDENTEFLGTILLTKSRTYAAAVLAAYEEKFGDIREDITNTVQDPNLARIYSYLAASIMDKYGYMAELLKNHSDGSDHWVTCTIVIGITHDNDLPLVKQAFTDLYQLNLADVILQANSDHAFLEVLALLVSSCYQSSFILKSASPP